MGGITGDAVPDDAAGGEAVVWLTPGGKPLVTMTFDSDDGFLNWIASERVRAERRLSADLVPPPAWLDPVTGEDVA